MARIFIVHIYTACGMNDVEDSESAPLHCITIIIITDHLLF